MPIPRARNFTEAVMTHHILQTDGATLSVADTDGADPALVFLHYWGGSSRTWAPVIERLAGTARCIAFDQRGWGESMATDGRYDLQAMAGDVLSVIDRLALHRYVLVGHSMGGKVAQIIAARHPHGLAGLVLVAPAPPTPMKAPPEQRMAMLESYQTRAGVLQALSVLASSVLPEALRNQVIADTLRGAPGAKQAWTQAGMLEDVSAGLASVTVPVSVVVGERDQIERESMLREALSAVFPQARFTILKDVGHLSPLEASEDVANVCVEFLNRLLPTNAG